MATDVRGLANYEDGLLSRRIFSEQEIYQQELENIFARTWLFLCHDSQIPNRGDFFSTYMGEDPVLVTRDQAGQVRAFLNVCRHRGNRVCRADSGNASAFVCAYHGWTYGSDGKLIAVPSLKEAYYNELETDKWGLMPVAKLGTYKGFHFATFDPNAEPLLDFLGEMTWYMDAFFDRREGGVEAIGGVYKWVVPSNWKFGSENFGADPYHVAWSHASAMQTGYASTASMRGIPQGRVVSPCNGHTVLAIGPKEPSDPPVPELQQYEEQIAPEVRRRLGPRSELLNPMVATVFPNFSMTRATAQDVSGMASTRPGQDGDLGLDLRRQGRAPRRSKRRLRLVRHPLLQPGRHLRAGRHGQLAGMHADQPGRGGKALPAEHPDGRGARSA